MFKRLFDWIKGSKNHFKAKPCSDCGSKSYTRKRLDAFNKLDGEGLTIHVYAVTITCKDCSRRLWKGQEESYYQMGLMTEHYRS